MKLLLAAAVLFTAIHLEAGEPTLRVSSRDGALLSLPSDPLQRPEVQKRLRSGLTASFVIEAGGERVALIGIRRDLWEEQWLIEVTDRRGRSRRADGRAIGAVWRELILEVPRGEGARQRITLTVYPFSDVESADTRSWLSQSTTVDPQSPPSAAIDAVIRTAIRARPVYRRQWTVSVEGGP